MSREENENRIKLTNEKFKMKKEKQLIRVNILYALNEVIMKHNYIKLSYGESGKKTKLARRVMLEKIISNCFLIK